jgi:hypothetical protein
VSTHDASHRQARQQALTAHIIMIIRAFTTGPATATPNRRNTEQPHQVGQIRP